MKQCSPGRGFVAAVLALLLLLLVPQAQGDPAPGDSVQGLVYLTEQYYPYNFKDEAGVIRGISADILRLVWKEMGVPDQPIRILPWARVYNLVQEQPGTVAFSMARTPPRESLFKWAGPIETVRFVLLAKKSRRMVVDTLEDLKGYAVGTLIADITDTILGAVAQQARIEPVSDMAFSLKMLEYDRIDLIAYEEKSFARLAEASGHDPDAYETVYVLSETGVYYAFHADTSDALVSSFQRAIDAVRARPVYREILKRYLPRQ